MKRLLYFSVFLLLTLSWLNPFSPGPSPGVVPLMVSWLCAIFVWVVAVWCKLPVRQLVPAAACTWVMAGLVSCIVGLLQYFGAAADISPWINPTRYGEAFANLRQRNQFATLTSISLSALVWLMVQNSKPQPKSDKSTGLTIFWGCLAASLLMVGNAVSSSRTGLFQLVLLCVLCGLWVQWRQRGVRWVMLCAVSAYALAAFAMPYLAGLDVASHGAFARLGKDEACSSRLVLWSNVLHLIAQKPWMGWGWGELDFAHFITLYDGPRFCDILDNAHNLPLHLAVELGVPVALLVCGGFGWWVLRQKPWAERDATRQMAWAVLAVILLHSMLEYPLWYGPFQIAFVLCLVILWRMPTSVVNTKNDAKYASKMPLAHVNIAQTAIITIAFTAALTAIFYAAWDYHRVSQIYLQPEARHAAYQVDTLAQARKSWLFADQALFAELILTPLTPATALQVYASAGHLLHYSPEPRVVEKLIESAVMMGKDAEALAYLMRFKAAFPKEHAAWSKSNSNAL